jgi:hypothetical protein
MTLDNDERDALDIAQAALERDRRVRASVRVVVTAMIATLALTAAAFVGWYIGGRP